MSIAIVTGASSGMGRETAIQLADRFGGMSEIWLIARRKERLEQLSQQLPVPSRIFALDLTRKDELEILSRALVKEKPKVKFLVNASGYGKIGRVGEVSLEEETGMVALNNEALCAVTHLVLPYLCRGSRILQFASAASFLPQPGFAIYAATKSFVLSYSRALNEELKPRGIKVTAVCPGPVKTEFFTLAETTGRIPLYKQLVMAKPERVVRLAIRDSVIGKPVSVYGGLMKLFWIFSKVISHEVIFRLMKWITPEQVEEPDPKAKEAAERITGKMD